MLSVIVESTRCSLRKSERMMNDRIHCVEEILIAPESYFDPLLMYRRRAYLDLVRLLTRRDMPRFTHESQKSRLPYGP